MMSHPVVGIRDSKGEEKSYFPLQEGRGHAGAHGSLAPGMSCIGTKH